MGGTCHGLAGRPYLEGTTRTYVLNGEEATVAKSKVLAQIEGTVTWFAHQDKDSEMWVATCPALNLTAVGDTWAELQETGNQATSLLFDELFQSNELEAFVKKLGWVVRYHSTSGTPRFDIPTLWEPKERTDLTPAHA